MLWPPDHVATGRIGAAIWIDAQLASKGAGRVGRTPRNAGAVTFPLLHTSLCIDTNVKSIAIAAHHQTGRTPIGIVRGRKAWVAFQNELGPAIG